MSFQNIDTLKLGKFLQIAFSKGIRNQISEDYQDWEMIKRARSNDPDGRELRFLFRNSYGPAAIQYRNPNGSGEFPKSQQGSTSEHTAVYKEVDATIDLEYNLWNRARKAPSKYAEPLAAEIEAKMIACKRRMAADLYGDGTGAVGTAESVADTTGANGFATVTLKTDGTERGHVGFFEYDDLLKAANQAGTAVTPTTSGTFYAWRIKDKDRDNDTVTLEAVDSNYNTLDLTASGIVDTNVFYRIGQPTVPDLTAAVSDYNTVSEVWAGLESLTNDDGRVVHGITMSGSKKGSKVDAAGAPLDVNLIEKVMNKTKIAAGEGAYKWKKMCMSPEAHSSFVESRETDRRFYSIEDSKRGTKIFGYQHRNDFLESYVSEYIPKSRLYVLPEDKSGKKVLEYHGTDFETVGMNGMGDFHLRPGQNGGHERRVVSYMTALATLICKHPAAIGRVDNYTL